MDTRVTKTQLCIGSVPRPYSGTWTWRAKVAESDLRLWGFFGSFIKIQIMYHMVHTFKVYNSVVFSVFTVVKPLLRSIFRNIFITPKGKSF